MASNKWVTSEVTSLSNQLTIADLPVLLQLFTKYHSDRVSYSDLGPLFLGLSLATLDAITKENRRDTEGCLRECLTKWLEKADCVQETKGGPTIYSLVSALRELGENEVADGIDMEMHPACRILAHYTSNQSLLSVLSRPQSQLAILLYSRKLLKEMMFVDVSGNALLVQMKEAVCADYSKLKAFADILCELTATVEIGDAIMEDYREAYESDGITVDDDENGLKIYLPLRLISDFKKMRLKFWETFFKVESIMKSKPQSPSLHNNIKHALGAYYDALKPRLAQCKDMHDILRLVRANSSLDDISLLEVLVNKFNIHEAKPVIDEYKDAVEELITKLCQFLIEDLLKASSLFECVTIVTNDYSVLNDVQRLSLAVIENLSLHVRLNIVGDDGDGDGSIWEVRKQKSFTDSFDKTAARTTRIIEKWLKEGSVELTVTRVNMHGPPGAGKTCSQDLLLNNPPTTHITDSTPIARPAVKTTRVSVDNETMKWEKVDRDGLLERLASDLKEAAASQHIEKKIVSRPEKSISKNSSPASRDKQQTTEPQDESTIEQNHSATKEDESSVASNESFSIGESVIPEIVGTIQHSEVQLNLSGHWLYIIDSGGQPAYQELLPLFVRTASLNIITLDLSQLLDKKLDFQYRIGGETFSCGLNFKYSNRDFFLSAVSSGAILKPIDVPHVLETPSHPMNFVLGTHYDLINDDMLKEMNKELMSSLKPDVESYVVPNVRGESIIFPVNTLVSEDEGRTKAGKDLCQSIANCGGTSLKINVPIRWFAFELWLQKVAEKKSRSFLIIDEVISAGARFKMKEDDTKHALQYLHNVTIILYYPDILPKLVFVDPKPILEVLSRLLALTYVERKALHLIANPIPSEKDISKLYNVGFFKEKLLINHFRSLFSPPHFEPSHLLKLLIHLRIIASGKEGDYFIPCALQSYTEPPDPQTEIKPLLIVWQDKNTLPVPQGMFPLLIIHLLSHKDDFCTLDFPQSNFSPLDPQYYKYRDSFSLWIKVKIRVWKRYTLHIINRYTHIEVYFVGSVQKAKQICPYIRELIMKAVRESADAINVEHNHFTAFSCPKRSTCYCVVDVDGEDFETNCTSCAESADISGDTGIYWSWFGIVDCDTKVITSDSHYSVELNKPDLDDALTDLKEGHYPSSNWQDLGLKLGLNYDTTLKNIESNYSKVEDCLRECIAKWLQRADGVDDKGGATWTTLANALEQCDSKPTADHIRCKILKRNASQSQTDDNELCPTIKKNKLFNYC